MVAQAILGIPVLQAADKKPHTVQTTDSLGWAFSVMTSSKKPYLVVQENTGDIAGYITLGMIQDVLPPAGDDKAFINTLEQALCRAVEDYMVPVSRLLLLHEKQTLQHAISALTQIYTDREVHFRITSLPVVTPNGQIAGVVAYWHLIQYLLNLVHTNATTHDIKNPYNSIYTVSEDDTLETVFLKCNFYAVKDVAVIVPDSRNLKGMISSSTVKNQFHYNFADLYTRKITEFMRPYSKLIRLNGTENVLDVAPRFADNDRIGALPVIQAEELSGLVTYVEILNYFGQVLS